MKKRMLAGMMAFIMAGMLTACGSSSSVSESAKSGEDKENKTNTGSCTETGTYPVGVGSMESGCRQVCRPRVGAVKRGYKD